MSLPRKAISLAATFALAAVALPAAAQTTIELEYGRSSMGSVGKNTTNVAFLEAEFNEYQIGSSRFSWSPDVSMGWVGGRNFQSRFTGNHYGITSDVFLLAGGGRFRFGNQGDWYHHLFLSEQLAGTMGPRTEALSTHYQFVTTAGAQWHYFSLQIRHISNASTGGPNRGETMLLAGLDFHL